MITRRDLHPHTRHFILHCLRLREADRLSWDEVFVHPIFNGYFSQRADQFREF